MERIVIRKRLYRNLIEGFVSVDNNNNQMIDAQCDQSQKSLVEETQSSEKVMENREKEFQKHVTSVLKRWTKKGSYEQYLCKNLLQNLEVKNPFKIVEKQHFRSVVKITFRMYFVQEIYSKEIEKTNQEHQGVKMVVEVSEDSESQSNSEVGEDNLKLGKREFVRDDSRNKGNKINSAGKQKRQRLRTLDDA